MIVTPADPEQTMRSMAATWEQPGPVYYRLGKGNNPVVDSPTDAGTSTGVQVLSEGGGGTLVLALGGVAHRSPKSADGAPTAASTLHRVRQPSRTHAGRRTPNAVRVARSGRHRGSALSPWWARFHRL
ncbi:MAG: hypothetical protein R2715_20995 [Ilumatobacteraceae bacterium]